MIPLRDENPRTQFPLVNTIFIVANIIIFVQMLLMDDAGERSFIYHFGAIPKNIVSLNSTYTLFTSMFLHGGFMHIIGNMLYLFIFGDNIESLMGSARYVLFYAICGVGATLAHILVSPGSEIPLVGASGAISGVLGAYAVCFPRARVLVAVPIFFYISTFRVPAIFALGLWFLMQIFSGVTALGIEAGGGIAWFAHIGGFVIGVILIRFFKKEDRKRRVIAGREEDYDDRY